MIATESRERATSPLCASQLAVEIEDLHAECTLTHQFRNDGTRPIEAVFSFPIPLDAAFLSLQARLGNETVCAAIQPKEEAERRYSDAINEGDSAVLLTQPEPGVLCLSLGNLGPGEVGEVVLRFAVWLRVANNEARFTLPLVHRPRYGRWRLEDIEAPVHDMATCYPLAATISVRGLLHGCSVRCSTHAARFRQDERQTIIALEKAMLDADVVVAITLPEALPPQIRVIEDGDGYMGWAAACMPHVDSERSPLNLCLVMDCSGSMQGDAIAQSREALRRVADRLDDGDRVQIIRFGNTHETLFRRPLIAGPAVRATVRELAAVLNANLGGTEMDKALCAAIEQLCQSDCKQRRAIILVTDGAVQPADIQSSRQLAHARQVGIFVVAVGSAAGVDVLAPLTESTGAALERAVPAEPIDENVLRQMTRARAGSSRALVVSWSDPEAQPIALPNAFSGEVAIAAARLTLPGGMVHLGQDAVAPVVLPPPQPVPALRALLGQRLYAIADQSSRASLACRYGLLTAHTSAVLVKIRNGSEKTEELPEVVKVPQMIPRGMVAASMDHASIAFSRRSGSSDIHGFSPDSVLCLSEPYPLCYDFCDDDLSSAAGHSGARPRYVQRTVILQSEEVKDLLVRLHHVLLDWLREHGSLAENFPDTDTAIAKLFSDPTERGIVEGWLGSAGGTCLFSALHTALQQPPLTDELEACLTHDLIRTSMAVFSGIDDRDLTSTLQDLEAKFETWLKDGFSTTVSYRSDKENER